MMFAVIFCTAAQIWPESIVSLMSKDADVIREGALYLCVCWDAFSVFRFVLPCINRAFQPARPNHVCHDA
jgi:Na+-driven multidrug efflux pump